MILDEIVSNKQQELAARSPQPFRRMLDRPGLSFICELKLRSPTHPKPFVTDTQAVLDDYKAAGADAISVVTDQTYFGGDVGLMRAAQATGLPVLRKDFILNPRQLVESPTEAILLIARIVSPDELKHLVSLCLQLGVEPVVEIHSQTELAAVLATNVKIIAVNSRDLQAQRIDLEGGLKLLNQIPDDRLKLLFSGVQSPGDIVRVKASGADGVLIGTSILSAPERISKITELRGGAS